MASIRIILENKAEGQTTNFVIDDSQLAGVVAAWARRGWTLAYSEGGTKEMTATAAAAQTQIIAAQAQAQKVQLVNQALNIAKVSSIYGGGAIETAKAILIQPEFNAAPAARVVGVQVEPPKSVDGGLQSGDQTATQLLAAIETDQSPDGETDFDDETPSYDLYDSEQGW